MTSTPLFLFGTLRHEKLLEVVAGTRLATEPAVLPGYRVVWAEGERFPLLIADADGAVEGLLIRPDENALRRLDFYEIGFGYHRREVTVQAPAPVRAQVYFPNEDWTPGAPFSMTEWSEKFADLIIEAARELMQFVGRKSEEDIARMYPQILSRADSRRRARTAPSPMIEDADLPGEAQLERTERPYADYFSVREDWLQFPRFGGGLSETVKRATFLSGDAVTVLPYDPRTENVLVIRQFRHGPFCRGDTNPWTLEPIAGRIDAGETAEGTAHREMEEEANLTAKALHEVGRYYPSPGAFSEWLVSYVAIADLDGQDGTVSGLATEAEDIKSHVMPLRQLLRHIETGAANTGPLILSAFWLDANKDRLTSAH